MSRKSRGGRPRPWEPQLRNLSAPDPPGTRWPDLPPLPDASPSIPEAIPVTRNSPELLQAARAISVVSVFTPEEILDILWEVILRSGHVYLTGDSYNRCWRFTLAPSGVDE